jgi:Na+/H+ antiporter NhaC
MGILFSTSLALVAGSWIPLAIWCGMLFVVSLLYFAFALARIAKEEKEPKP